MEKDSAAQTKELIDSLKNVINDYDVIVELGEKTEEINRSISLPQPEFVQKEDDSVFSIGELEDLIAGKYDIVCDVDENESEQIKSMASGEYDLKIKSEMEFKSKLVEPEMQKGCSCPISPRKPNSPKDFIKSLVSTSGFLLAVCFALICVFTGLLISRYARMGQAERKVEQLNEEQVKIESLFENESYTDWSKLWNGTNSVSVIIDAWNPVYEEWQSQGYVITKENLTEIIDGEKSFNGKVDLKDVEPELFQSMLNSLEYNQERIWYYSGEFGIDPHFNDMNNIGKVFFWIFEVVSLGLFIFIEYKRNEDVKPIILDVFTYPFKNKKYIEEKKRYDEEIFPEWEEKQKQIDEKNQNLLEDYQQKLQKEKNAFEREMKRKIDADIVKIKGKLEEYKKEKNKRDKIRDKEQEKIKSKLNETVSKIKGYEFLPPRYKYMEDSDFFARFDKEIFFFAFVNLLKKELLEIIKVLEKGRAETLKEAISCVELDKKHKEELEKIEDAFNSL